jgi:hypothetical protein
MMVTEISNKPKCDIYTPQQNWLTGVMSGVTGAVKEIDMDVSVKAGDIYNLDGEISVYGSNGIELRLGRANQETVRQVMKTLDCVKDSDVKDRRFTVAYNPSMKSFRFEPTRGETVRVREDDMMRALG